MGKKQTIKLEKGTIYQKEENGTYYYRFQVNGQRKTVSLKTKNIREAKEKAKEFMPVVQAQSLDVVAAHVSHAQFNQKKSSLYLDHAWEVYSNHPDRALPATVSEQQAYEGTWREFLNFVGDTNMLVNDVTVEIANRFAEHMRTRMYAVDTHNRKIRRLKKIFSTLSDYTDSNPFSHPSLRRKPREEDNTIRRLAFSKEQEQQLLDVLEDDKHKLKNKAEVRVLFYLGMFTGQRLKDCALLQWYNVKLDLNRIWVKQFKTGKNVSIPIAEDLLVALKEAKQWQCNDYVLPNVAERYLTLDKNGKNVGANLLNIDVMRVIRWIGVEPSLHVPGRKKKVTVYGFHSLRHSFASHCAESGVPKAVTQSILGADNDIIDKYYVHVGEEAQKKAIETINFGEKAQKSPQERIDEALAYIDSQKSTSQDLRALESILRGS
jgi:integrase